MSGIAGIYNRDKGLIDKPILIKMLGSIKSRGGEGEHFWQKEFVGLCHSLLMTTPESLTEIQPYHDKSNNLVIVADARIDNRPELLSQLNVPNDIQPDYSDSKLILSCYLKWGEDCFEKLIGDFSFAIWDGRNQKMVCVRDPFGVKPFYYYLSPKNLFFASSIKTLFFCPQVPRELLEEKLADFLVPYLEDKTDTFYKDIYRLEPGTVMVVGRNEVKKSRFWQMNPKNILNYRTNEEYEEHFRELFQEAVRCRLRSAFPVGSLLSGGLDSSSIVVTAEKILAEKGAQLHTFSAIFENLKEGDEREYIDEVLSQSNSIVSSYVFPENLDPIKSLKKLSAEEEDLFLAPNLYWNYALYKKASENKVRVILDGLDGDSTVSHGFYNLMELFRHLHWGKLIKETRLLSQNHNFPIIWKLLRTYAFSPLLSNRVHMFLRWIMGKNPYLWGDPVILNSRFKDRIKYMEKAQRRWSQFKKPVSEQEAHWQDLDSGIHPYTLEVFDKASVSCGVEPRYPFFDRRLIDFCLALPSEQKIQNGWTRSILRRSLKETLPKKVCWRKGKAHFGGNLTKALIKYNQTSIDELFWGDFGRLKEYVNARYLNQIRNKLFAQKNPQDAFVLWRVIMLSSWLNQAAQGDQTKEIVI